MGLFKSLRKIAGFAAPVIGTAIGGPAGGIIGGAAGGALSGGGLKGALTGAATGAITGYAPQIGGAINNALGTKINTSLLGGAVGGGALGALSGGGLRGALTNAATTGAGAYLANGGLSETGKATGLTGPGSLLGESAKNYGVQGPSPTGAPLENPGSGILGAATRATSGLGNALRTGFGGGGSSYGGAGSGINLGSVLGAANDYYGTEKAKKELEVAQGKALGYLNPYLESGGEANKSLSSRLIAGFDPSNLADNPAFKFNLDQGQKSLDRTNAARGGYYSGAALKEAGDFTTNLANNYAKDYYNQWADTNNQIAGQAARGLSAAGGASDMAGTMGTARANATLGNASRLSQLLAGYGAMRRFYDANGNPIYVGA